MFNKPSPQEDQSSGKDPNNPISRLYRAVLKFIGYMEETR